MVHKQILVLVVVTLGFVAMGPVSSGGQLQYTNPVIPRVGLADPCVLSYKGTYYLYPTAGDAAYTVYTSSNLVDWSEGPVVFKSGEKGTWAPEVFHDGNLGKFYLYFTADHKIGIAVSDSPLGPFERHSILLHKAIDAQMFQDSDGAYYLYFVKWASEKVPYPFTIWCSL